MKRFFYTLFVFVFSFCSPKTEISNAINLEIKGADISYLPEIREKGIVLRNQNNEVEDMLLTLKKAGVNTLRLRLWHNPSEKTSNFAQVKKLSKEIKNLGFKLLLTVHYSDHWADPSQQTKPQAWQHLGFEALQDSVYAYTQKIVIEINPDYIQIGNEINGGLLWAEGHISKPDQMKMLLQKGIEAVRTNNKKTKIILHHAGFETADYFFATVAGLDYDIIGLSYYPFWHGKDLNLLKENLNSLSTRHNKPIFIAETSYPFTFGWNDWTDNVIGLENQILNEFSATPQGQKEYLGKLIEIVKNTPKGIGFCYWGAEWISYQGKEAKNGSSWENQAFWDFNYRALPVLENYR